MRLVRVVTVAPLVGALAAGVAPLRAQTGGFAATYGLWWLGDSTAATFSAVVYQPLLGPFGYSLGFTHLDDAPSAASRTLSGAEIGVHLGRDGRGAYAVASVGAGLLHRSGDLGGLWSAGLGYAVQPLPNFSLALEARYRTEDRDLAGFWRLHPDDRRGLSLGLSLAIGLTGRQPARGAGQPTMRADPEPAPSPDRLRDLSRASGADDNVALVTTSIVETAIDVMGTPYRWGGTSENGFDCSGLIQYAYAQHGIVLPRVSRDQMRMGQAVDARLDALRPGDLLGFSVEGTSRITHIGLYVGDGRFIHSASDGVKLTSLTTADPDSRWWQQRWVAARRILQ